MSNILERLNGSVMDIELWNETKSHVALLERIIQDNAAHVAHADAYQQTAMNNAKRVLELEAKIDQLKSDPVAVHINMLRGQIAKPSWRNILHLYPKEHDQIADDVARIGELEAALALFIDYDLNAQRPEECDVDEYNHAIQAAKAAMKETKL